MMFYSGDTDGAVGLAGSRQWIKKLNWPVKHAWTPWLTGATTKLVRGYVTQYEGLDFVTVHGVGHMAPQWAREPVTTMITNWIQGNPWSTLSAEAPSSGPSEQFI